MRTEPRKKINIPQVCNYLHHAFSSALQKAAPVIGNKNVKGTDLYRYQVDFCYIINDIQNGPTYIVPKKISLANEMIDKINNLVE